MSSRKPFSQRALYGIGGVFAFLLLIEVYAFWIEPYWIEVTYHHIEYPLPRPLKIAHVSDLHSYFWGRREKKTLELIQREKPDVIVFTGDMIHWKGSTRSLSQVLPKFSAPLGVWAVRGNWEVGDIFGENGQYFLDEAKFYEAVGVHLLVNRAGQVRDGVWFIGLDEPTRGWPKLAKALKGVPANAFKIALFHSPDYFPTVAGQVNLALTGHTHGGQVRLPFIQPFWLPPGSGPYLSGWYEENGSRMYVSRGIGNSSIDARFGARPELSFITIGHSDAGLKKFGKPRP